MKLFLQIPFSLAKIHQQQKRNEKKTLSCNFLWDCRTIAEPLWTMQLSGLVSQMHWYVCYPSLTACRQQHCNDRCDQQLRERLALNLVVLLKEKSYYCLLCSTFNTFSFCPAVSACCGNNVNY